MRDFLRWVAVMLVLVFLVAGCSSATETGADLPPGDPADPADQAPAADPGETPEPDGRSGPGTGTPRQVPPLVVPPQPPGSDEAYIAMITDLDRFITDEQRVAGVPWPDLRNTDPVAAYRSCAEFQSWMSQNNPTPTLVEAYTAPNSPERGFDLSLFEDQNALDLLATPSVPPYSMRVAGLVHPAATDITNGLLAMVPEGSVAVVYWDSVGRSSLVDPTGRVYNTSQGWTDVGPWVAIMAPTDVGWQVWWDELTETPPPGLDDDRGLPDDQAPRPQV